MTIAIVYTVFLHKKKTNGKMIKLCQYNNNNNFLSKLNKT